MKIEDFWSFLRENSDFFSKMATFSSIKIDFKRGIYYIDDGWMADPFFLILRLFRDKFNELGPSNDQEFTRIQKMLNASRIKTPFGKKEYDSYVNVETRNQTLLNLLEVTLGANDGKFMIPTKEYSNQKFKDISNDMENVFSGLFIYEHREARYYVDIYDRLTGFEVFLDNGTIYIPVRFEGIHRSAFKEDSLRKVDIEGEVSISDMSFTLSLEDRDAVYIPEEYTDSIINVARYFRVFDIVNEDDQFILNTAESIYKYAYDDPSIKANGVLFTSYLADLMISKYTESGSSSIAALIDIARVASAMTKVHKSVLIDNISKDISGEVIELVKPYIDGSDDNHVAKISELTIKSNLEFCSRVIRLNGDPSSIRFFNKKMKYYKDFNVDRNGVLNDLIPELGGFRYIASFCNISSDNVPAGYTSVDSFIIYAILKVVQSEFGSLPVFDRFYGDGIHSIFDKIVFNSSDGVHGLDGKHGYNGVLLQPADIDVKIPKLRATKQSTESAISEIVDAFSGFVSGSEDRDMLAAVLTASSLVVPILKNANKPVMAIYGCGPYTMDGAKKKIFNGVFKNAHVVNTDSDFVIKNIADGSSCMLVTTMNKSINKVLNKLATERFGSETISRFKNTDNVVKTTNTAPILVFTEEMWLIDESIVFNFPARASSEAGSFLYEDDDVSGTIASFVMSNEKKLLSLEEKFVAKVKKELKKKKMTSKHPYVDFFEKILASMCLVEATGFMDGWEFHDKMHSVYFNDDNIRYSVNFEKLILSIQNGSSKVEDKLHDQNLRMNQNGDSVAVDKVFHMSYLEKEESDVYVLLFDKRVVYKALKADLNIGYVEFVQAIEALKSYINIENAMRNYRLGSDKTKTIYNWYLELFDGVKDDFGCIKINKKSFYGL